MEQVGAEEGPFANYVPYTHHTGRVLETVAEYRPKTLVPKRSRAPKKISLRY